MRAEFCLAYRNLPVCHYCSQVYLKFTERCKIDFRLDGISVAVKLIDGVIAKLGGTSFSLGSVSLNENQLLVFY